MSKAVIFCGRCNIRGLRDNGALLDASPDLDEDDVEKVEDGEGFFRALLRYSVQSANKNTFVMIQKSAPIASWYPCFKHSLNNSEAVKQYVCLRKCNAQNERGKFIFTRVF